MCVIASLFFIQGITAKVYLVSVGIADYPGDGRDLYSPVNDASVIAHLYENSTVATCCLLTNEDATIENIASAINMFTLAEQDDIVVFYYSGHGYQGGMSVYDGYINYDTIRKSMSESRCKRKMIFIDTCFSGGITIDSQSSDERKQYDKDMHVMLFLSARNNEYSRSHRTMKNAYFTHFLHKGLKGRADLNRDKIVTAKELFGYVHQNVKRVSNKQQHPVMWGHFPDNMPIIRYY